MYSAPFVAKEFECKTLKKTKNKYFHKMFHSYEDSYNLMLSVTAHVNSCPCTNVFLNEAVKRFGSVILIKDISMKPSFNNKLLMYTDSKFCRALGEKVRIKFVPIRKYLENSY